ncbi:MAG: IclR family transcriptional regulator [Aliishimia sp.]
MSSAVKTLELLKFFSDAQPEIGLTQLCRMAKRDKATTHRHLQDLEKVGFVEQNMQTKDYRLGPAVLQLAQTRENTVPRKAGAKNALHRLSDATGETAHVSVLSGTTLYTLDSMESPQHSIRVIIDLPTFPLHATASGLCVLAFGSPALLETACENLEKFTEHTLLTKSEVQAAVEDTRKTGFGCANKTFEDEVYSLSVPLFDQTGAVAGALSLASVASRFTHEVGLNIRRNLMTGAREVTRNWGGSIPASLEERWANALENSTELEILS